MWSTIPERRGPIQYLSASEGAPGIPHTFIPDVLKKGCWPRVTEKDVTVPGDVTVLRVENGRLALAELSAARFGYPAESW